MKYEIRRIALPVILSNMAVVLFETINVFWIGMLGRDAVAGTGAASFITWMVFAVSNLTGRGTCTYISQTFGQGDLKRCRDITKEGFIWSTLLSIILMAVLWALLPALLTLMGLTGGVRESAYEFLWGFILGLPILMLFTVVGNMAIAYGDAKLSTRTLLISLLINLVLDPFLILGWGGFPALGVKGAAIGWAIAELVGIFLRIRGMAKQGYIDFSRFKINWSRGLDVLRIGFPPALSETMFSLVYPFMTSTIVAFGSAPLAALNICHRIEGIPYFICVGFASAASTLIGQRIGAGKPEEAMEAYRLNLRYISMALLIPSLIFILLPGPLMSLFIRDAEVIAAGASYLRIIGVFEIFLGWEIMTEGAFGGTGETLPPMFIRLPLTLIRVPLAIFVAPIWGLAGIWWVLSTTTLLKGLLTAGWFLRGRWQKVALQT